MFLVEPKQKNFTVDFDGLPRKGRSASLSTKAACSIRIEYEVDPTLPRLAWAALVTPGQDTVRVLAGKDVTREGDVFWEGLSLSPDEPVAALDHHFPLSTGGMARSNGVAFWTPGHILDRLFVVKSNTHIVVSNSLPFALKASGTSLVANGLHYPWHFGRILAHCQSAPLARGKVMIVSNANLSITRSGSVQVSAKPAAPCFDNYAAYIGLVHAFLDEVAEANRRQNGEPYRCVATLSSGYDSPAASALGKRIGLADAISITDSRGGAPGDDSGEAIAAIMGLSLKTGRRTDYQAAGWDAERLFYVFGQPEDIYMYPFRGDLKRTLLFTGVKGDTMWDRNAQASASTWSWDPGGATMQEFRLRVGFVHLPPAFFGWRHHDRLIGISRSAELDPWSFRNSYDRPIPRRLVEECGVPRDFFGMDKKAVSATIGIDHDRYVETDALGISQMLTERLLQHMQAVSGPRLNVEMALSNGLHNVVRAMHKSAHSFRKTGAQPQSADGAAEGMTSKMMSHANRIFPIRRKYMAPFSMLNFSTQVANACLSNDYADFSHPLR